MSKSPTPTRPSRLPATLPTFPSCRARRHHSLNNSMLVCIWLELICSPAYIGEPQARESSNSCYWARLKDLSGGLNSLSANDNAVGQYYLEVLDSDEALETACDLSYLPAIPNPPSIYPETIKPGMYLVGADIQPGTYKGQAGADYSQSCYWQRIANLTGDLYSIIANDERDWPVLHSGGQDRHGTGDGLRPDKDWRLTNLRWPNNSLKLTRRAGH